ncbi:Gibberellin 3-beta-dioxygenase 1 [Apostasia shenzhenica]|uniref:Gibberellin 3-beta-dioxygenase 1 n=1 Tax=Apostasia shenzhenica TaxID=1088818 RepID=A0A2H9ZU21_9ASPA|nr:Gibberellin 3-beta-dioxygenase 1 [Apostasia shenzhenica]
MPSLPPELFDLYSARHIPESHTWASSYLYDHPIAAADFVPTIDISRPDAASLIGAACRCWGMFLATGHRVPAALLGSVESQTRRLFSLPLHRKLRAASHPGSISGYGRPPLSSFFPKLMWSEGFTLAGDPTDIVSNLWPGDHSLFCEVMEEYKREMKDLAGRLMGIMLQSLGLAQEEMGRIGPMRELQRAFEVLQLNSYPACPDPERAMGMAAHTDSGLFTVLHQSAGAAGLQVLREEAEDGDGSGPTRWVAVQPLPEALVVNVGDLFHILSNGRFRSAKHRAVVGPVDHRVSVAYFVGPPGDVKVEPVRALVDPIRGPVYRPVTWPEYLGIRARVFDQALVAVRSPESPKPPPFTESLK